MAGSGGKITEILNNSIWEPGAAARAGNIISPMEAFQADLKSELAKIGLIDYDVYGPYLQGILVR